MLDTIVIDKDLLGIIVLLILILLLASRIHNRNKATSNPGEDYEYRVAKYLRKKRFKDVMVTKASRDYGVDIIARKGRRKYAIQCKYYSRAKPVGLSAVQEVFTGMAHYNCNAAMVVTNSTFTQAAETLAEENNVVLIWGLE